VRILHVLDYLPELHSAVGGAEFVAQRIIHEQAKQGVDVHIATLLPEKSVQRPPWTRAYHFSNLDRLSAKLAYAVKQLYLPIDPLSARGVRKAIEESQPDLVHYHNLHFSGLSVLECSRAVSIPSVLSIYDYWLFCPSFMLLASGDFLCDRGHGGHCVDCVGSKRLPWLRGLKKSFFQSRVGVFERFATMPDHLIALSEASKQLMIDRGVTGQRIEVIPQYIWEEGAESSVNDSPVPGRMTYVGWVERRKGLHVVVAALAKIAATYPEAHLEVLGLPADQDYQRQVEKFIDENGLADRVKFRGRLPREQLLSALQSSQLVVVPEQWENMSPVILTEALAAGCAVLASRIGGIKHFVNDYQDGLLADRLSPASFAEKMSWAFDHPSELADMRHAARRRALSLFGVGVVNMKMNTLYERAIARNNGENE